MTVAVCVSAVEHRPLVERITVCVHGALAQRITVCALSAVLCVCS